MRRGGKTGGVKASVCDSAAVQDEDTGDWTDGRDEEGAGEGELRPCLTPPTERPCQQPRLANVPP